MLNLLINRQKTAKLVFTLLLGISLLNACATKTPATGGAIKPMPRPVQSETQAPVDGTESETAEEGMLSETEMGDDVSSAPIRARKQEILTQDEFYDSSQSNYQLPIAKKRRAQPEANAELRKAYRDALREMDKALNGNKNFSEALRMFEEIEQQYPAFSGPRTNIGMIYLHQKEYQKAADAFNKALEINDENEHALSNLALTYRELGKFSEAKTSYQKAIELNPNDPLPHYNLGILAELYLRDLPLAIQSFEHYKLANRKKDPEVDNWLIDLNNRVRQQQAAEQAKKEAAQQAANPVPATNTKPANNTTNNAAKAEPKATSTVDTSSETPSPETPSAEATTETGQTEPVVNQEIQP